jgi:hypothetical protein
MKTGVPRHLRRSLSGATAGILAIALTACSGHGGGKLAPDGDVFTGPATFGFSFSCERSSRSTNLHLKTGRMRFQLNYRDHGTNPLGSSFGIHGIVEEIDDPVLESMICIGDNPPPEPENVLTFTGRYRLVSGAPAGFPSTCPALATETTPLCRFEVTFRDNDMNGSAGTGDFFQIRLSTETVPLIELDPPAPEVFYTRGGVLSGGNITVD